MRRKKLGLSQHNHPRHRHNRAESNFAFALVLHYYALWLVNKTRATFSTNGNPNQNQSCFRRTRFPALGASCRYLRRILIGSLCCLHLLRLARVITLVLVLAARETIVSLAGFGSMHQYLIYTTLHWPTNSVLFDLTFDRVCNKKKKICKSEINHKH